MYIIEDFLMQILIILYQPTNKGKILFVEFINFINNLFVYNNNNQM